MEASGVLKDFYRGWALPAFISSSLAAMHVLCGDTADPSYIIDAFVSIELRMLRGGRLRVVAGQTRFFSRCFSRLQR